MFGMEVLVFRVEIPGQASDGKFQCSRSISQIPCECTAKLRLNHGFCMPKMPGVCFGAKTGVWVYNLRHRVVTFARSTRRPSPLIAGRPEKLSRVREQGRRSSGVGEGLVHGACPP